MILIQMKRVFFDNMKPFLTGDMDGMKNSPANGPGTPRDDLPPVSGPDMGVYPNLGGYQDNVSCWSA